MILPSQKIRISSEEQDNVARLTRLVRDALETPLPAFDFGRPVFLLNPSKPHGGLPCRTLLPLLKNVVAAVDDEATGTFSEFGIPYISSEEFRKRARDYKNPLAVDLSITLYAMRFFKRLCAASNIEYTDFTPLMAQANGTAVYVSVNDMRRSILDRADAYFDVVDNLADRTSKEALLSAMLFKLTCDREATLPYFCGLESEYFTTLPGGAGPTFKLGSQESFVDVGAHHGQTVKKFLAAVDFTFDSIHAFEPDRSNFDHLSALHRALNLPHFHIRNAAISDANGVQSFHQTGSMGSHIGGDGDTQVETVRLDRAVERATFIKADCEGHEKQVLTGATGLVRTSKPRLAICAYHYPHDLLDIVAAIRDFDVGYELHFRQHMNYYYDEIVYACLPGGWPS